MRIRIVNKTGHGQDTRVYLELKNECEIIMPLDHSVDISECFFDSKIRLPANGEVQMHLEVDRAKLDIVCNDAGFIFPTKD